jgi:ABC-2 type transport system permease protein
MAALTEHPSTAAILTLSVTVGTWIINFFGAVQGGWWERAAGYTPAAMVAEFQHGLVRFDTVLIALVLTLTGLGIAAVWMRLGMAVSRRVRESASASACSRPAASSRVRSSPRVGMLPKAEAIRSPRRRTGAPSIHVPLRIEVHLAPEDPRRVDLEHHALSKLRRVMPKLEVQYVSNTSIGLFEQTSAGYGEIWYDLGGRRTMSRVTTAEGVLEAIYSLAGVTPPAETDEDVFRGHPLAVPAKGAGTIFYALWPALFLVSGVLARRRFK